MRLSTSIFFPLFLVALVAQVAIATPSEKTCSSDKKQAKHHRHPHHKHHSKHPHHHHHHHQQQKQHKVDQQQGKGQQGNDQQGAQTAPNPSRKNNGSSYSGGNSYNGVSSKPKNVGGNKKKKNGNKQAKGKNPFGAKAGIGGCQALDLLKDQIGWAHDWNVHPSNKMGSVIYASTLYGIGQTGREQDVKAWQAYQNLPVGKYKVLAGYNEADYDGGASSGLIAVKEAARKWDQVMRAHKEHGTTLIGPSCAKQLDEDWMGPFLDAVQIKPDFVNVHVFSDDAEFILKVLEHYRKYGYKMVVTEFACINFNKNKKCNQEETIRFLYRAVEIFENAIDVVAYSLADADNGDFSHLSANGKLTKTGWAYRDAISNHSKRDKVYKKREASNVVAEIASS